jgi:hypothetical protein
VVCLAKKKIEKKSKKKMSWCSDAPEDEAISLFAGLIPNPDVSLSLRRYLTTSRFTSIVIKETVSSPRISNFH